jgi:hypothetical protein
MSGIFMALLSTGAGGVQVVSADSSYGSSAISSEPFG